MEGGLCPWSTLTRIPLSLLDLDFCTLLAGACVEGAAAGRHRRAVFGLYP